MLLVISLGHSGGIKGIVGLTDDHNKKLDHIEIEKKVCHALLLIKSYKLKIIDSIN